MAPSSPDGLVWGHSSRRFAFGGVSPCIILGQYGSDGIPIVFPTAGKTILGIVFRLFPKNDGDITIPPCAPSIRPRNCTNCRQFRHLEDLTGYWIGGLPVYQGGGPPLDFEKTGLSLLGLRGDVGGMVPTCNVTISLRKSNRSSRKMTSARRPCEGAISSCTRYRPLFCPISP